MQLKSRISEQHCVQKGEGSQGGICYQALPKNEQLYKISDVSKLTTPRLFSIENKSSFSSDTFTYWIQGSGIWLGPKSVTFISADI